MTILSPLPEDLAARAIFLTEQEKWQLWEAAVLMADSRGMLVRLAGVFGRQVEGLKALVSQAGGRIGGVAWLDLTQRAQEAVEDVLWNSYAYAIFGLEAAPHFIRPKRPRKNLMHRLATTASGAASGFAGLPGVLVDIPFTTATILRSIAEVARDSGEDLSSEETRRACLEVLAFGSPNENGEQTETGYWAARLGVSHLTINLLIRSAAGQFGLVLSEKLIAQMVPVAGAVTGGLLNYSFTDYYQGMAKVHFCLRALEKRTGDAQGVKLSFEAMVKAARERRRIGRRRRRVAPVLLAAAN
ncbi:MAG: EcsC family protein [Rhodospirillales bacterium]|nr:EcsC family protein [Rhodospirillales bacterium]